ncbi:MAG: CPBP family intramembrane metalloprotease [Bacteroidota bacterium]|nr:CPBP family intramembrane metalloprotease [Bacteroidota bacterium]
MRDSISSISLLRALRDFGAAARAVPRDISVVLIGASLVSIASWYFGSRRFFRFMFYPFLGDRPLYELYEFLYWFGCEFVLCFVVPFLLALIILHRKPRDIGVCIGDWKFGLKFACAFLVFMIPILWVVSDSPVFQTVYPHAQIVKGDWRLFLAYEAGFIFYFIGWEYLWRGFVLFGLEKHLGGGPSVLIQMLPFVILHSGKPVLETLGAVVAGIALGALALRTRSYWYGVLTHWSVMLTIDLFTTLRFRTGAAGIGIHALFQLVGLS